MSSASTKETLKSLLHVDESKISPLPRMKMGGIFLASFADQFSQLVIMPFLPPLCEMFFPDAEDVGVYVGIMQSLFYFTQFFAAPYWGSRADTIGRRPIFLLGLVGVILGMLLIGFAHSFGVVCLSRVVVAGLCVTPVIAKTYIGEILDHTNQHRGFAVIGVSVGLTTFIAPLIGGYLSQPAESYESFNTQFWIDFPYLLPCLVAIGFAVIAMVYVYFFIPESEGFKERKRDREAAATNARFEISEMGDPEDGNYGQVSDTREKQMAANRVAQQEAYKDKMLMQSLAEQDTQMLERGETPVNLYFLNRYFPPIARTKTVGLAIVCFTFHAMITIIFDTMFPVFCEAPFENGGLNLSVEDTGILLSVKGVAAIVYQATIYPKVGGKFGARTAIIWCLLNWCIILVFFPLTSSLSYTYGATVAWYVQILLQMYRAVVASTGAMALMMIINNSVPRSVLGQINGVSTSCSSASRCIGPLWAGAMWTASVTNDYWRLSGAVMYWVLAIMTTGGVYVAFKMPMSLNMPMGRKGKKRRMVVSNVSLTERATKPERDY